MAIDINLEFRNIGKKLSDEKWADAIAICDILFKEGYNFPEIYQARLLAEAEAKSFTGLKDASICLEECYSYKKVLEVSDDEISEFIEKCNADIKNRKQKDQINEDSIEFLNIRDDNALDETAIHEKKELNKTKGASKAKINNLKKNSKPSIFTITIGLLILLIVVAIFGFNSKNKESEKIANQISSNEQKIEKNDREIEEIDERIQAYNQFSSAYSQYRNGNIDDSLLEDYAWEAEEAFNISEGALLIYQKDYDSLSRKIHDLVGDDINRKKSLSEENLKLNGENMKLKGY